MNANEPIDNATRNMINQFKKPISFSLEINDGVSLYKEIEKINNDQFQSDIYIVGGSSDNKIYTNFIKKIQLEQLSIGNKNYLIKDSLIKYNWINTKEIDTIQGFKTAKAFIKIDENTIVEAWYAKDLPYKIGPKLYSGLPGLILRLKTTYINQLNSYQIIECVKISTPNSLMIPSLTKGEKISRKDYNNIYKEYSKKIRESIIDECKKDCGDL